MEANECVSSPYSHCTLCPRRCKADRVHTTASASGTGKPFCGESEGVRLAWAGLHTGEEPPISVWGGSGALFFTGCNLRCSFCQNHQISQAGMGREVDEEEFTRICLRLQDAGAENINLVTASHQVPRVAHFIQAARGHGLVLPVVWNSSAYESVSTLRLLSGVVDVWLPDFKTTSDEAASLLFASADYPRVAKEAIEWMVSHFPLEIHEVQQGGKVREKITRGVIVRHLALPGRIDDTIEVLQWLKDNVDSRAAVSLMSQFTPVHTASSSGGILQERSLNVYEMETLEDLVAAFDFQLLYKQEAAACDALLLPDFEQAAVFPPALATPLWHWKAGFVAP